MIRINKKNNSKAPDILLTKGAVLTEKIKSLYDSGSRSFSSEFDQKIYGNEQVKSELKRIQDNKCCYCERKIFPGFHGDIEHFRPKSGWFKDDKKLSETGYYWLVYDWNNLFISCQHCNQVYKKNHFPILVEDQRALNHHFDIKAETPALVHPADENPEDFIEFEFEIPRAINNNIRGLETIRILGLDNKDLNADRLEKYKLLQEDYNFYVLARKYRDTSYEMNKFFDIFKEKILNHYKAAQQDDTEYASMLRSFFRKNPIN